MLEAGGKLMWKVALGIAVFLQAGATRADQGPTRPDQGAMRANQGAMRAEQGALSKDQGPTPAEQDKGAKSDVGDDTAVHVECPSQSPGEDCTADEVVVPGAPPAALAAPAAVATVAPAPTAFATVSFRNDVGKKLRLIEARFTMDGEDLPVVLTAAEPGKSYLIVSRAVRPGPHVVAARLTYRGDRGVFTYMKGYRLNVRSNQLLTAPADRTVNFTLVGTENRGLTVPFEKRVVVTVENGTSRK